VDPDEGGQPGGVRILGMPLWVVIVAVILIGVVAWIAYRKLSGGGSLLGGGGTTSGGGGTATSGNTTLDKGAVTVSVTQAQPGPPVHGKKAVQAKVPDETGKNYTQAAAALKKAGFNAQRTSPYVGKVTRMSPHAGSSVPKGTYINLSGANKGNTRKWPKGGGGTQKHKKGKK
jgi:hypothetical protein